MRSCRPTGAAQLPKETTVTRPAAHCHARQITQSQSHGTQKKESTEVKSVLSFVFRRATAGSRGSKESWGVARGDRKPWCPVPFCPSPREGRVPARRSVHSPLPPRAKLPRPREWGHLSPPASRPQYRRYLSHSPSEGENNRCPREGGIVPFRNGSTAYPDGYP